MSIVIPALLPSPEMHKDWQSWARALVAAFQFRPGVIVPPLAPAVLATDLPDAVEAGVMFYVTNATGAVKLAVSNATGWVNVGDGSVVA